MDLEISHVKKGFKNKPVLQDITFSARKGDCVGILGGNGCGKTGHKCRCPDTYKTGTQTDSRR